MTPAWRQRQNEAAETSRPAGAAFRPAQGQIVGKVMGMRCHRIGGSSVVQGPNEVRIDEIHGFLPEVDFFFEMP
jgi:hypothetical protein